MFIAFYSDEAVVQLVFLFIVNAEIAIIFVRLTFVSVIIFVLLKIKLVLHISFVNLLKA